VCSSSASPLTHFMHGSHLLYSRAISIKRVKCSFSDDPLSSRTGKLLHFLCSLRLLLLFGKQSFLCLTLLSNQGGGFIQILNFQVLCSLLSPCRKHSFLLLIFFLANLDSCHCHGYSQLHVPAIICSHVLYVEDVAITVASDYGIMSRSILLYARSRVCNLLKSEVFIQSIWDSISLFHTKEFTKLINPDYY